MGGGKGGRAREAPFDVRAIDHDAADAGSFPVRVEPESGVVARAPRTPLPSADETGDFVTRAVVCAATTLFESTGHPVTYVGRLASGDEDASVSDWAVIDFDGDVSGVFAVSVAEPLLRGTNPATWMDRDDVAIMDDWRCEMANLLLGAVKNELLRSGATTHLHLPRLVSGNDLQLAARALHRFSDLDGRHVDIVLDAVVDESLVLEVPEALPAECGEVVLFFDEE